MNKIKIKDLGGRYTFDGYAFDVIAYCDGKIKALEDQIAEAKEPPDVIENSKKDLFHYRLLIKAYREADIRGKSSIEMTFLAYVKVPELPEPKLFPPREWGLYVGDDEE